MSELLFSTVSSQLHSAIRYSLYVFSEAFSHPFHVLKQKAIVWLSSNYYSSMGTLSRGRCDNAEGFQFSHSNVGYVPGILNGSSERNDNNLCGGGSDGSSEEEPVAGDYFDGVYDYIKQMLMEDDDLEHRPCMFQDCSALQAAEKYFYDALLSDKDSNPPLHSNDYIAKHSQFSVNYPIAIGDGCGARSSSDFGQRSPLDSEICRWISDPLSGSRDLNWLADSQESQFRLPNRQTLKICQLENRNGVYSVPINENVVEMDNLNNNEESRKKKAHDRGDNDDCGEKRSGKQLAGNGENSGPIDDRYDKSLLCPNMNPNFYGNPPNCHCEDVSDNEDETNKQYRKSTEVKRGRPKGSKKNRKVKEVVDLRSLLTRCAQAVSNFDTKTAEELLKQIRQSSSPYGDSNERLAHCFANALEARMSGTGSALYSAIASRRTPASELLKSYQAYVTSCPFKRMSNIFANKTIAKQTEEAKKVHIIDFGILYGFQWPCIIHGVSLRPGGPPMLKITGIEFPQPGFKPAERVEQTGNRLKNFCNRFNVPFEYNAIAKKWNEIRLEDLKIEKDEMVVVNCMYRLRHVLDESMGGNSPRDDVLRLINKINPDMFVHGVVNGTYNAPFFTTRFREALYHYSSFFDMMEATLPREDEDRLLYEREVFGRDVMNVIACEGWERVERPDTYKQWQVRVQRAGFRQLCLSQEILREVKIKVLRGYHNDFLVDGDSEWMLQGWKGRVMYALSVWKPI